MLLRHFMYSLRGGGGSGVGSTAQEARGHCWIVPGPRSVWASKLLRGEACFSIMSLGSPESRGVSEVIISCTIKGVVPSKDTILDQLQAQSQHPSNNPSVPTSLSTLLRSHPSHHTHFPLVKNNRSPTSPNPGTIMPLASTCASTPPTQTSTPSLHSSAALLTPASAPSTLMTRTRSTPHSFSVWIAATDVPPVAMMGSRRMARGGAVVAGLRVDGGCEEEEGGEW